MQPHVPPRIALSRHARRAACAVLATVAMSLVSAVLLSFAEAPSPLPQSPAAAPVALVGTAVDPRACMFRPDRHGRV